MTSQINYDTTNIHLVLLKLSPHSDANNSTKAASLPTTRGHFYLLPFRVGGSLALVYMCNFLCILLLYTHLVV